MRRLAALFVLCLSGCSVAVVPSETKPRAFGEPETVCMITDRRITESSGLAPSLDRKGVWYTHNDSSDGPNIYAFDATGKVLATYQVEGAKAVDWEDMSSAQVAGQNYLYLGDIGDNLGRRNEIVVYRVREPGPEGGKVPLDEAIHLRYPDEPHNAEALIIDPATGAICVITKSSEKTTVYVAGPEGGTLRSIGTVSVGGMIRESRKVTGGDISPDGAYVVLRTYMGAYEFSTAGGFEEWPKSTPLKIKTNLDLQGEGIAYARDGKALWTSSEMSPCQISRIPLVP